MIYGYARVSTQTQAKDGNSLEVQERLLRKNGAEKIYADAFTGTKTHRPELNQLLDELQAGDTLVITKLDRIARSASQGIELAFAEFERDMIVERTQEGKAIARKQPDYREGRPRLYGRKQIRHALELLKDHSYRQVTEMTGISKSTLIRAKKRAAQES